jgi:hypothetical protein
MRIAARREIERTVSREAVIERNWQRQVERVVAETRAFLSRPVRMGVDHSVPCKAAAEGQTRKSQLPSLKIRSERLVNAAPFREDRSLWLDIHIGAIGRVVVEKSAALHERQTTCPIRLWNRAIIDHVRSNEGFVEGANDRASPS